VQTVIEDALALTYPLARYSKMSIDKAFGQDIPLVIADRAQLQEVFVAVILHALDSVAEKPKGGELSIHTKRSDNTQSVDIIFSDTGIGIKPAEVKQVGFTAAHDIVASHHGTIKVEGREGGGTTFIITLPSCASPKAQVSS